MSQSFRQPGDVLTIPAPAGGVISGRVYLVGVLALVALQTAAAGQDAPFAIGGAWQFEKPVGINFAVGELAYYDTGTNQINKSAVGRIPIGAVIVAAVNADEEVRVRLFEAATAVME